ncbi:MAG TPA: sigma 54-interacting transcriptional regulator, partial [bacterium]|nr:sigma 54-interacting transcriptional regulator [bacterium]
VELYAQDAMLEPLGAVSYLGIPLFDTDDSILGHLAILHDAPMTKEPRTLAIFNIFANRAAAELRRVKRDRDLREREQKLTRFIETAMDAIIELDGEFRILNWNGAAENLFGRAPASVLGTSFDEFLTPESRGKLLYLARNLENQPQGKQSLWIPDGLEATRGPGQSFPVEATLSRFEVGSRPYSTLILRSIHDRMEAEERIRSLMGETAYLRAEIEALHGFDEIVGSSPPLRRLLSDVDRVAREDTTVLITGETGTGKELIARAIHRHSARAEFPLITVNCAAIPANLQESEFFGHERGAFTGATQRRDGRFKLADRGTIFLDEVGELPLDLQAKLLRVLQEGEIQAVGSSRSIQVDVRVIAATNRDLERMVAEGTFRKDLLYRLNVFPLSMPPLRERGEDIALLAESFARNLAKKRRRTIEPLTPADRQRLLAYDWPGNVRELQNVIERAFITSTDGKRLNLARGLPEASPAVTTSSAPPASAAKERILTSEELQELERANTLRALQAADWKISGDKGAADLLGLKPNTLASRMRALGIQRPSFSDNS